MQSIWLVASANASHDDLLNVTKGEAEQEKETKRTKPIKVLTSEGCELTLFIGNEGSHEKFEICFCQLKKILGKKTVLQLQLEPGSRVLFLRPIWVEQHWFSKETCTPKS